MLLVEAISPAAQRGIMSDPDANFVAAGASGLAETLAELVAD